MLAGKKGGCRGVYALGLCARTSVYDNWHFEAYHCINNDGFLPYDEKCLELYVNFHRALRTLLKGVFQIE